MIKLADTMANYVFQKSKLAFNSELVDDLESEVAVMPQGQLQFLTIVNYHLLLVNQHEEVMLVPLHLNPYVEFCIELVCGASDKVLQLYRRSS